MSDLYVPGEIARELMSLWPVRSVETHVDAWAAVLSLETKQQAILVLRALGLTWEELAVTFDSTPASSARTWGRAVRAVQKVVAE